MARSARSSVTKKNNAKLKARVFGPVENARTERLSAKLLELAAQAAPLKTETGPEDGSAKAADSEAKEKQHADGALHSLSIPIPQHLLAHPCDIPSPPATPPHTPEHHHDSAELERLAQETFFYSMLGVSDDVEGFSLTGRLILSFRNAKS
ncbi:hypothetical protein LTR66_000017 [Elasticomyces elasticus]|nr:hypothetical protein LTR66_000017 [Elasticomyces elasticus]